VRSEEDLMRRSLIAIAFCLLMASTLECGVLEARAAPSADFSSRTVTAERGSSFSQQLTLDAGDTNYRSLKVYFVMPEGVTCPDDPKRGELDSGDEWSFTVTFQVSSSANLGTYTVNARAKWEEFDEGTEGWEGGDGGLTKFTLTIVEKTTSPSGGSEETKAGTPFSSLLVFGISGVALIAVAAGILLYSRSRRRSELSAPTFPMREIPTTPATESPTGICRYCGFENIPGATYCRRCGRTLGEQ